MKKVSLLILLVIVLSTVLMAAVPTKMARITIINKSDYDVYMKLTGSDVTEAFYYLTIPTGSRDEPTVKIFTVMQDLYDRETWQCNGARSTGSLFVTGNLRLTFTSCGQFYATRNQDFYYWLVDTDDDPDTPPVRKVIVNPDAAWLLAHPDAVWYADASKPYGGEPTMEKVVYFRYLSKGSPVWSDVNLYTGYWNWGCATLYWRARTYRRPLVDGCYWRYQY